MSPKDRPKGSSLLYQLGGGRNPDRSSALRMPQRLREPAAATAGVAEGCPAQAARKTRDAGALGEARTACRAIMTSGAQRSRADRSWTGTRCAHAAGGGGFTAAASCSPGNDGKASGCAATELETPESRTYTGRRSPATGDARAEAAAHGGAAAAGAPAIRQRGRRGGARALRQRRQQAFRALRQGRTTYGRGHQLFPTPRWRRLAIELGPGGRCRRWVCQGGRAGLEGSVLVPRDEHQARQAAIREAATAGRRRLAANVLLATARRWLGWRGRTGGRTGKWRAGEACGRQEVAGKPSLVPDTCMLAAEAGRDGGGWST
jgi:hypothetical protein